MTIRKIMNRNYFKVIAIGTIIFASHLFAKAQIAQGGNYTLDQSVIASGGGQLSTGGNFALDGTIGQPIAGTSSTGNSSVITGGFWTAPPLAPTAASASVSGRILTPEGRGLINARVILIDMQGNRLTAMSSTFGYYHFQEVEVGQTYIFTVASKRYQFTPQVLTVMEEINDLDFLAQVPID